MAILYNRFFKITLRHDSVSFGGSKARAFFLQGQRKANGWFCGQRIRNHTQNGYDVMSPDTYELIDPSAVAKWTEYYEDRKYGWLTSKTLEQQKREMCARGGRA